MNTYLIEVPHEATEAACINAIKIFLESGSHFLSNAEWGCEDGEHKAWLVVDVNSKEEAMKIIPSGMRPDAKVIKLRKFTNKDKDDYLLKGHINP